jgi:hypothetical protein
MADSVEKVLFGLRTKFLRTADAFRTRRREGPHCFTQKRPPTVVLARRSVAAVETAKNQLSRDFRCASIFDFFNSIGAKRAFAKTAKSAKLPGWTSLRATTRSGPRPCRHRPRRGLPLSPHDGIGAGARGGICPWRTERKPLGLASRPTQRFRPLYVRNCTTSCQNSLTGTIHAAHKVARTVQGKAGRPSP